MNPLLMSYNKGAITADHFAVECLHRIDPAEPSRVLHDLPDEVVARVLDFARRYRPGGMVTNYGVLPTSDQVEAAERWIANSRNLVAWASSAAHEARGIDGLGTDDRVGAGPDRIAIGWASPTFRDQEVGDAHPTGLRSLR